MTLEAVSVQVSSRKGGTIAQNNQIDNYGQVR